MEAAYNTAWGWDDGAKRRELTDDAARFVLVRPKVAADAVASVAGFPHPEDGAQPIEADPQLEAWNEYVEDLRRREPPGAPPS